MKSPFITGYLWSLVNPAMAATAVKVALVVGSILFAINHGSSLIQGKMNRERWISALLTYCVPYSVSVHGQYTAQRQKPSE